MEFADPRAAAFLDYIERCADDRLKSVENVPGLTTGCEMCDRLVRSARRHLRLGDHILSPFRALQRPAPSCLWSTFWSAEAESCAWRGAGVFTDYVCGVLVALSRKVSWDYPGDPWHWLLEPGEVAPRTTEARYNLIYRTLTIDTNVPATDVADRLKRCRDGTRAVLDLESSMRLARARNS